MKKLTALISVGLGLTLTLGILTPVASTPALADAYTDCGSGNWASWKNKNFGGGMFYCKSVNQQSYTTGDNETSAVSNRTSQPVYWYANANYTGLSLQMLAGWYAADLSHDDIDFNDRISSTHVG